MRYVNIANSIHAYDFAEEEEYQQRKRGGGLLGAAAGSVATAGALGGTYLLATKTKGGRKIVKGVRDKADDLYLKNNGAKRVKSVKVRQKAAEFRKANKAYINDLKSLQKERKSNRKLDPSKRKVLKSVRTFSNRPEVKSTNPEFAKMKRIMRGEG